MASSKDEKKPENAHVLSLDMDTSADSSFPMYTILLAKGEQFPNVPASYLLQSQVFKTMINNCSANSELDATTIDMSVFKFVHEYMQHHANDASAPALIPKPLKSCVLSEMVESWDAEFIGKLSVTKELFGVVLAAHHLDMKPLQDLCCARIASSMKGKTPEQIRALYNIKNDFSPEQEAQVRKETSWAFETAMPSSLV